MKIPIVNHDKPGPKQQSWVTNERIFPYLLIAPSVILIVLLMGYPIFNVFQLSLQNYSLIRIAENGFVGFNNFLQIFTNDPVFRETIPTSIYWVVINVVLQLVIGMIIALLLNRTFKGRGLIRSLTFIPWAVSGVMTTMLWILIFNQHIGLLNTLLNQFGITHQKIAWLANPETVFGSVIAAETWRGIPFFAVVLLAALQNIPPEIYESCAVDGCGPWRKFWYVTLPFLKESILFTTLLRAIFTFNHIDMIFTMTNGGPIYMTTTLPLYMMKTAITDNNYGYGSALAVVMFFILLLFAVVYLAMNKFGRNIND